MGIEHNPTLARSPRQWHACAMDDSTLFALLVDLHLGGKRQGPGSAAETLRALDLTRVDRTATLNVADIGCGSGASTLVLAKALPNARITAIDLVPDFLEILTVNARTAGCSARITARVESMDSLTFAPESLDLIWSEGAIYNMGFSAGISAWHPFLKTGGVLAVSEMTWLRPDPPTEILEYWNAEYPEIATAPQKIAQLEAAGFDLLGYLTLQPSDWLDEYYEPAQRRIPDFLARHVGHPEAEELAALERGEADLYRRFQDVVSYGFYIARKR